MNEYNIYRDTRVYSKLNIGNLFPEILSIIFSYLDTRSKGRACRVCRCWRNAGYTKQVWKNVKAYLHLNNTYHDSSSYLFPSLVDRGIKHIQVLSLKGPLSMVIDGIPTLETLILKGVYNVSDSTICHSFQRQSFQPHPMPFLLKLDVSFCKQISDHSVNRIARAARNLRALNLSGCSSITSRALTAIAMGMPELRKLEIRGCRRVSDNGIMTLAGLSPETAAGTLMVCRTYTDS